ARIKTNGVDKSDAQAPVSEQVAAWLASADAALGKGQLASGKTNALALYTKVLEKVPDNHAARAGMVRVARRLATLAHKALREGDAESARRALAQLQHVPGADTEVTDISKQLALYEKVAPLLAHAADLIQADHALTPKSDNALAVYRQVLKLDADNSVALQGLLHIQRSVLDDALAAVAQNDYSATDAALTQATAIAPQSQALQDTRSRIEGMRRQQAENILAQARSALDGGHATLAKELLAKALAIRPDIPGVEAFNVRLRNAALYAAYRPGQIIRQRFLDRPGSAPATVVIPIGSFLMGSTETEKGHRGNESPQHRVTISQGFAIGLTEVTVGQFRDFINASHYVTDAKREGDASVYNEDTGRMHNVSGTTWRDDYRGEPSADQDPVVNVSWNDAQAYVQWLAQHTGKAYRLPSEAEFEYAMRANSTTPYWWGDGKPERSVENVTGSHDKSPSGRRWANSFSGYGDGYWGPAPVKSFVPNPFGLYDMDGNVSEWVSDCWHDNYTRATKDGSAWINPGCTAHVLRGGSWGSSPVQVRSAYRQPVNRSTRSGRVGFRVARSL
ncbi:MAG: SUMF1/EgtB/PvdO family nonheme iron enzyme, partial [Xanthomonadales bacterium]|nr:SUMF1/EgtB/PvdO family nonheme iron enzyme [Xanthomonadales bacterium]